MSDRDKMHPDDLRVEQRVKDLPRVGADAEFREALRARFASGTLEPAAAAPPRARPRFAWRRGLAVAAVVVASVVALLNRAPQLRVVEASGSGSVVVDGRPLPVADLPLLKEHVRAGVDVQVTGDARLDLLARDVALVELTPGTQVRIPPMPRPLFARSVACTLAVGEMHIRTGPGFRGATWRIFTPHGMVEVTGTLLSVQCDDGGTCVCVLEGVARVGVDEGDLERVDPGFRKVIHGDGTTEILPAKDMHRDGLLDFDRRVGSRISRGNLVK